MTVMVIEEGDISARAVRRPGELQANSASAAGHRLLEAPFSEPARGEEGTD
jgi:hypothetical protein